MSSLRLTTTATKIMSYNEFIHNHCNKHIYLCLTKCYSQKKTTTACIVGKINSPTL